MRLKAGARGQGRGAKSSEPRPSGRGAGAKRSPPSLGCLLVALALLAGCANPLATPTPAPAPIAPRAAELDLPNGFTAELVADGLSGPTQMIAGPGDRLWVAQLNGGEDEGAGQILSVNPDTGGRRLQLGRLMKPTGIALHGGMIWIAAGRDLLAAPIGADDSIGPPDPVLTGLPFNGRSNGTLTVTPHGEIVAGVFDHGLIDQAVQIGMLDAQFDQPSRQGVQVVVHRRAT